MNPPIRWGILGTGIIARAFAGALATLPDARLVGVGSRSRHGAETLGHEFGAPHRHGSYAELAADPDVDVVYVATPHTLHAENTLLCLDAGKAVLCEKPFTINAVEAERVIDVARRRRLFLMEAMWTRFIPAIVEMRRLIAAGAIGETRIFQSDFSIRVDVGPEHRMRNPNVGGGALLDLGVYPVSMASMLLGEATEVAATAILGPTGVDEATSVAMRHAHGLSSLFTSIQAWGPTEAEIIGTEGRMHMHRPMHHPTRLTLTPREGEARVLDFPFEGSGYQFEALEVMRCLREDELESGVMPLDETLSVMRTLDRVRGQIGVRYPSE